MGTNKEYHKMVWGKAYAETLAYYRADLRNWIGNVIVAVLSGIGYGVYEYIQEGTMIDWLGVALSVVFGFAGWIVILFLYNLIWKVPAVSYRKKEIFVKQRDWEDVDIKGHGFEKYSGFGVGLEIANNKISEEKDEFIIRQVTPTLEFLISEGNYQQVDGFFSILQEDNISHWNGGRFLQGVPAYIPIANTNGNDAWIEYKEKQEFEPVTQKIQMKKNTDYTLRLVIGGRVGRSEIQMNKCFLECGLRYTDEQGLEISILTRQPEYNP